MNDTKLYSPYLKLAAFLLFLAVALGAFGAHLLKNMLEPAKLITFQTGVTYHMYHALALILISILGINLRQNFTQVLRLYLLGILLFSFNCYVYAVTGIKTLAMLVPLGGLSFMLGHLLLFYKLLKEEK